MKDFINKLFKKWLMSWVLKNYPFNSTTKVHHFKTIYVKKGKMREWRTYNEDGKRMQKVIK